MKKTLFATTVLSAMAFGFAASAQSMPDLTAPPAGLTAGAFIVHLNALGVLPQDTSSNISKVGGNVSATNAVVPELDMSYFLTDNVALALILATSEHTVKANNTAVGSFNVGSVWALPPTLTVQYHFLPHELFNPYVGIGLNGTLWYGAHASSPVTHFSVGDSWAPAFQAGFDYNVGGRWFVNVDVKYVLMDVSARVDALGTTVKAHDSLNPLLVGAGIGYRF